MMNATRCQAASLGVGSDESFMLIRLLLPAGLLGGGEGVGGSWRESRGDQARWALLNP